MTSAKGGEAARGGGDGEGGRGGDGNGAIFVGAVVGRRVGAGVVTRAPVGAGEGAVVGGRMQLNCELDGKVHLVKGFGFRV
jgi:hypothetical protein